MSGSSTPVEVFYSYAHEDEAFRNTLEKHLSLLRRQGLIQGFAPPSFPVHLDKESTCCYTG